MQVDVPGAGVADDFAVARLREERALPERRGQRVEAERGEEALAERTIAFVVDVLLRAGSSSRRAGVGIGRLDESIDVLPLLRPHVAEQVRGDRALFGPTLSLPYFSRSLLRT